MKNGRDAWVATRRVGRLTLGRSAPDTRRHSAHTGAQAPSRAGVHVADPFGRERGHARPQSSAHRLVGAVGSID
jgi:hypothetical protein